MDTSQATPAAPARRPPGLLINRNFALLWSGQSISVIGDATFTTTLVLWVATILARNQPWAPLAVSGVFLAMSVPTLVAGPIAGVFVDRWEKRRTLLRMDAARALLVCLLLLLALGSLSTPSAGLLMGLYAIVAAMNVCTQFFTPARFSLLGLLVDRPLLARASGLSQTTNSLATVIGPSVATLLFFTAGLQWALVINALSFVVSFCLLLPIRPPQAGDAQASSRPFWRELGEGVRFCVHSRVLVTLLIVGTLITLGSGALNALGVFFVTHNLHTSAQGYGFLNSAYGVGAIVGALLTGLLAQRVGILRTFWLALLLAGLALLLYARLTSFGAALVVVVLIGLFVSAINVVVAPLVLHTTPPELVGRISSVLGLVLSLAAALSFSLAGYLDGALLRSFHASVLGLALGPVDTIYLGTGLLVLAGGFYALVALRRLSLTAEPAPGTGPEAGG
ncbi:MAG TPA: MFS transporter [Ktedonobacteraceae bacterium]|jgi:MFS family permease